MATQWKDSRGRSRQDRKGGKGQEKKGKEIVIRDGIPTIGEYSKGIASGETQRLARWGTAIVLKGGGEGTCLAQQEAGQWEPHP